MYVVCKLKLLLYSYLKKTIFILLFFNIYLFFRIFLNFQICLGLKTYTEIILPHCEIKICLVIYNLFYIYRKNRICLSTLAECYTYGLDKLLS